MDHSISLHPKDLSRLHGEYLYARSKWKTVGCALGINPDDLDAIDIDNRKCEDCFRELLLKWLRQPGRKAKPKLDQAIQKAYSNLRFPSWVYIAIMIVMVLFSILSAIPAVHMYRWITANPLTTAAHSLKKLYRHHPVVKFELLDFTANMPYINVTMQSAGMTLDFWELLNSLDSKHMQLQASNQPKILERILITGYPGAGKTTLMRHIAKEWANDRILESCRILFLLHLDTLPKDTKPLSLSNLLKMSPLKDYLGNVEQISTEISKHGTGACFLLDSYDGWHWNNDIIYNLIFKATLHSSLCVLTSRPFRNKAEQPYIEYVQVIGFNSSHLEEYLRISSTSDSVTNSILDLWERNHKIKEMCELPLNLVLLIFIAMYGGNIDVYTRTEIYLSFQDTVVKHFNDHHPYWNTVSLRECISNVPASHDDEICTAFKHLHYVAFKMHIYHQDKFPEYRKINENINKLGFVNITKIKSIQDEVKYTFFHPTFLELFAAIHLITLPQEQQLYLYIEDVIKKFSDRYHEIPEFWLFFIGLMGAQYNDYYGSDINPVRAPSAMLKQTCMFLQAVQVLIPAHVYLAALLEYLSTFKNLDGLERSLMSCCNQLGFW